MVEKATLFCPFPTCSNYGQMGEGVIFFSRVQGKAQCTVCRGVFSVRHGTAFMNLHEDEALICCTLKALAEGLSIRATARVFDLDKDTVCHWLETASAHCQAVTRSLFRGLHLNECQLDELWAFVHKKEQNLTPFERLLGHYGETWGWMAFSPEFKVVPAFVVGKRRQEEADRLIQQVDVALDGETPLFTSDLLPHYEQALLNQYGVWVQPERRGCRGRFPHPVKVAPEDLLYAVVVKHRQGGRVVKVETHVVFGDQQQVLARLKASSVSQSINTSFVERGNEQWRQHCHRLTRKTNGFSKELPWLEKHLHLCFAYYHFVLPHGSLRRRLRPAQPTKGTGSKKKWVPCTPAMAIGLTDHVWTMHELLNYRVPPRHTLIT